MNNLSIVIITRNRLDKLKRCLRSVKEKLPEAEMVVVDNGSVDGTVEFLKKDINIKARFLEANIGVAAARNVGIKIASRMFVMFLDDDAWIEQLPIDEILNYFRNNRKVGIVGPRILYPNGSIQESARSFPTIMALMWRGLLLYKIFPNTSWYKKYVKNDNGSIHEIDWVISSSSLNHYTL